MANKTTPVLLIEHAQTRMDARHLVHGDADVPLNPTGRQQAVNLGMRLKRMVTPPAHIYSSDRKRAATTARIAGRIAGIPVTLAPELQPLAIGQFAGHGEEQVAAWLTPFFDEPQRQIPGGESVGDWRAKHLGFMQRVAQHHAVRGEIPAFVTHSNVIGSARSAAKGRSNHGARTAMAAPPPPAIARKISFPLATKENT